MSVSIPSLAEGNSLRISDGYNDDVVFRNEGRTGGPSRAVPRKDLFEALESVCGVTVIDNNDLTDILADWEIELLDPPKRERARLVALRAIKAWKDTPEVDETQVERLADLMNSVSPNPWADSSNLASRLIETGKVEVHD